MRTRVFLPCAVITLVAAVAAPAGADEQDMAREMADRALTLANDEGNLTDALDLFKQAALLDPEPEYFCSAGNLYEQLGKLPQAHLWLSQCLAGGRMAARKPNAAKEYRKMLEALEQKLRASHAPVEISSTPSGATVLVSAFDDKDEFKTPAVVWLPHGEHTVQLSADGYVEQSVPVAIDGTKSKRIEIALEASPVSEPPNIDVDQPSDPEPDTTPDTIPPDPRGPRDTSSTSRSKTPLIIVGVGAVSLLTGGVFHVIALGTRSELADLGMNDPDRPDKESAFNLQRGVAIGGYAVGAVAVGVGLYLWKKSSTKSKSVAVGPSPAGDGAMVWLSWSQ